MNFEKYSVIKEAVLRRYQVFLPMACVMSFFLVGYAALDREAPVIKSDVITLNYGERFDVNMINIEDNRATYDELTVNVDTSTLRDEEVGSSSVIVEATDMFNNTTTKIVEVKVEDHVAPNFELVENEEVLFEEGKVVVNLNGSNDVKSYINAIDNADGDITEFMDVEGSLDTSSTEPESLTLSIKDSSGNVNTKTFDFIVRDLTAPVIALNTTNEVAVDYGSAFYPTDYLSVSDNSGSYELSLTNEIDTTKEEPQTTTVVAKDGTGHVSTQELIVTVGDVSAPVINISDAEITEGASYDVRSHLSVVDNKDGDVTANAMIDGSVDGSKPGKYTITITATDSANNTSSKTVTITVRSSNEGIINTALSKNGSRYVWGATGPSAFDCSGFAQWVYGQNGKYIGRTTGAQYAGGTRVSSYQPGDLLFFNTEGPISHVGIYIGNGRMIHAANSRSGVKITNINESYWANRYAGAVRY